MISKVDSPLSYYGVPGPVYTACHHVYLLHHQEWPTFFNCTNLPARPQVGLFPPLPTSHLSSLSPSSSPPFASSPSSTSSSLSQPSATFYCFTISALLLFFHTWTRFKMRFLLPTLCWSHRKIYRKLYHFHRHQKNYPHCHYIMNSRKHNHNHPMSLTYRQKNYPHCYYITNSRNHNQNHPMSLNLHLHHPATKEELFTYLRELKEHYTLRRCWNLLTFMLLCSTFLF